MFHVTFYLPPVYAQQGEAGRQAHEELIAKMLAEAAVELDVKLPAALYAVLITPPEMLGQHLFRLDMQTDEPLPYTLMGKMLNKLLEWVRRSHLHGKLVGVMQVGREDPWSSVRLITSSKEDRKRKK